MSLTHSAAFIGCVFLSAPGPKLPFWCTRCSTTVHRRTLACLLTLPTYQVAEDFALPASTASFSLRFTAPLLAAEHFRLLALRCGNACHRRSRRRRLWQPSALESRRLCHWVKSWHSTHLTCLCLHTAYSGPSSVFLKYLGHSKNSWLIDCAFQTHVNNDCMFALCPCPYRCSAILHKKDIESHQYVCQSRRVICEQCGESLVLREQQVLIVYYNINGNNRPNYNNN